MSAVLSVLEFTSKVPPARRASCMDPHKDDLLTLKRGGYSLAQMKDFLHRNGVQVTRAAIHAYLKSEDSASADLQKTG